MLLRRVARPMLAALFIHGGIQALRSPQGHAQVAKPVLDAVAPAVDKAIEVAPIEERPDDVMLVRIDGGVKVVAGTMLALGKFPRLSSAALAASLIPTTLAGHRFWEETDEQKKQDQLVHFLKNMGMLGGLLIAAADTEGKPSLTWRGRKAAKLAAAAAGAQAASFSGGASDVSGRVSGVAHEVTGKLSGTASDATGAVAGIAAGLAGLAPGAGAAVSARAARTSSELTSRAGDLSADWAKRAAKARKRAEKRGAKLQKVAEKRGAELQKRAAKRTAELQKAAGKKRAALEKRTTANVLDQASKLGQDVAARASALGAEAAHQAGGVAKDAKKRAHALTH
ncbi:DoxX family protein [Pseudonocardia xinjiangensis]|uniref:DoxX family protein n=1 Tax=Pseudonocardia xinjiangensis TaxID=75289 RepID=UPI003D89DDDC